MKKNTTLIIMIFLLGLVSGLIIQNFFNVIYSEKLENSLELDIKISQGEKFQIQENITNIPDGAIIDDDGSISRKINQTKND